MEVIEAILNRRSIRGFKPDPVPRKLLEEILETCRWAPSAQNTQAWELAIVGGNVMDKVRARLDEKVRVNAPPTSDLPAADLPEPYAKRAAESREALDAYQFPPGTENLDAKRLEYLWKGGRMFDVPNAIFIYTDKALDYKAIISAGILAQTINLAAFKHGLGTCIMTRVVNYPEILRELLGIPDSKNIVLGIAIGYPDPEALVNSSPRHRLPVETFTKWHGF